MPGLAALADLLPDAVTAADLDRRVFVWNRAAEDLYSIPASDALGRPIDELYDSTVVGGGTSASARALALDLGVWRGRVLDRPLVGSAVGQERTLDLVLSRLEDAGGRVVGVLAIKRDVTMTVRIEAELATLGSAATSAGSDRPREAFAERALQVIIGITGAQHGSIIGAVGSAGRILAGHAVPDAVATIAAQPWAGLPAVRAVAAHGRVINGAVVGLPLAPGTRRAFLDAGIRKLVLVGLHRGDEIVGMLSLGWRDETAAGLSDPAVLAIAAQLNRGFEHARLTDEVARRAERERVTAARLHTLDELIRVGTQADTIQELADRSSRLVNTALSAAGTAYGLLAPDGQSYVVTSFAELSPSIERWLRDHRPSLRSAFRRWRSGEGAFVESLEPGVVPLSVVDLAQEVGVRTYAAIPIREGDIVVGGIAVYFDRAFDDLPIDRGVLERVATIVSVALANHRLRERLLGSERRYRTLFEESPDALIVAMPDGSIIDANEAADRIFRTDREWLVGRRPGDLAEFEDDAPFGGPGSANRVTGSPYSGRAIGRRRDGERFPVDVHVAPIELDGNHRLLIRAHDLTDQERLQAELIQAQKMEATGQLVSGVAHELNNPLASILGFSELIRRDPNLPEDLRHNADLLIEEATRTRQIVQNLLDFARQRPPERRLASIRALIDSVLALQSHSLGQGRIEVQLDVPETLPPVELDRGQLQQVLVNLLHNAIYAVHASDGGRIRISAAEEGPATARRVRVTVMDDGVGVAPEDVGRLFEAFFTTKPSSEGTGLGLPVSYGIVRSHGGELRYAPASWGRGAAFTFDLPIRSIPEDPGAAVLPLPAQVRIPADADSRRDTARGAGPRVLVIDDEASIRVFLERALRTLGYEPVVATTGEEAIAQVKEGDFAALICDHQMPGLTGLDVHAAILATRPDLADRYILMSGDVLNPTIDAFLTTHQVPVLAKPFDMETLDGTVRRAIAAGDRAAEIQAPD